MGYRRTSRATRAWRMLRVGLHLARAAGIIALWFPFETPARRKHEIRDWSAQLLRILGVTLHVHGKASHAAGSIPAMLVANHVSWLDIFAINAVLPVRFVAKAEVRRWPVIGWLSAATGSLFIERARRLDTARLNDMIVDALHAGDVVGVFPEATTTDGSRVLRFHSSLLQPASIARAALHAVALRYSRTDGTLCIEAAYDGDKTLWDTLMSILTQRAIAVHLEFLPPMTSDGRHRRDLAVAARETIVRSLYPPAPGSHTAGSAGPRGAAR